jgi:hypothetical protein
MSAAAPAGVIGQQLWIENGGGAPTAHRVILSGRPHHAVIDGRKRRAIIVRKVNTIGEGSLVVAMAELTEAAPLSAADEAEYQRLDAELAGTIGDSAKLVRFNALRLRWLMFGGADHG